MAIHTCAIALLGSPFSLSEALRYFEEGDAF